MRVAGILKDIDEDYGPGRRTVVLFQGCAHNCDGCNVPDMLDPLSGIEVDIDYVIDQLKSDNKLNGITLSGGDPFDQVVEFGSLLNTIRTDNELSKKSIWVYTGYKLENLVNMHQLLKYVSLFNIDYLIDDQYMKDRIDPPKKYCGSNNQRIIDMKHYVKTGEIIEWRD